MKWAVVTPAYGRNYKTAKEAEADFNAGKDFILHDPTSRWDDKPCNCRDLVKYSEYTHCEIRFGLMYGEFTVVELKTKVMA